MQRLHHFFEKSSDERPDAIALAWRSQRLTYRQLDRRANQLAHLLLEEGVRTGDRVGILVDRSLDTYVALLGILKADAVYVPLDTSFPPDRLAFIATDAALSLLVTTSRHRDVTRPLSCPALELDLGSDLARKSTDRPELAMTSDEDPLCYVIYTSGSTGQPKGVAVSHANICNFLRVVTPIYGIREDDRVYQGMALAFDFSVEEIWPAWIAGATLVAGPVDSRRLGSELGDFLLEHEVTVFCCVPTLLATIDRELPLIRTLIVGGEACPAELVKRWHRADRRMLNTYGPTEATVTATWCELSPGRAVTIGKPLPTYRVYLLDEQLRRVREGEAGEICIGGPGVARGYLNRPDLTEKQFVSDPFTSARLYRSGDLGRLAPNGEIEYLGRIDSQVKIRGYRIELSEIEAVLHEDPEIAKAVVRPLTVDGVVQDLSVYVTLKTSSAAAPDLRKRLHASLRRRLPQYMVPSFIEVLDAFPMLTADKVNLAALPTPSFERLGARSSAPRVAPSTALEARLGKLWQDVLGWDEISVEDDFFCDLGGHSLAAAGVISRLRRGPGLQRLAIVDLYANPTIRTLARHIEESTPSGTDGVPAKEPSPELRHGTLRVLRCGVAQLGALYALLLLFCIPTAWLPNVALSPSLLVLMGGLLLLWAVLLSALLPVAGRLLTAGLQPGSYPLWGSAYLRVWLYRKLLIISPLFLLAGSPLLPPYLRLLGAKVGSGVHLATDRVGLPTLLEIGDGVNVGYGVNLQPMVVERGWMRLSPIRLGSNAFVGTNSVILGGAVIGERATVTEQSLVAEGQVITESEHWGGSPSARLATASSVLEAMDARTDRPGRWTSTLVAGFVASALALIFLPLLMVVSSILFVGAVAMKAGILPAMATTVVIGPLFVVVTCAFVICGKRLVMPEAVSGIFPLRSRLGLRKWISDRLMAMSLTWTNTLYATLYIVPFLRSLGARIGEWSEVSTVAHIDPNMLHLGPGSFVADLAAVGPAIFHNGCVALGPAEIGRRTFVGNAALIPGRSRLGNNSLVGVLSVPPTRPVGPETSWLGSPAIFLPRREVNEDFSDELTYRPPRTLVAWRLGIEFFRVFLPATVLLLTALLTEVAALRLSQTLTPVEMLLGVPILIWSAAFGLTLFVVLFKWLVIGRYRPRVEPLWSVFVRRTELVTGLYESVAVPVLIQWLTGTPWIAPVLRLFGARVGRRVYLDTTYLTEFDLVHIDDDATIGFMASLQTHLFEDRVMKMSVVRIGRASSIGERAVVLYDAVVGEGAVLNALSLAMKGETLPEGSHWHGIPARVP